MSLLDRYLLNQSDLVTVSNPPPSPVTDGNRDLSSDFDTHDIGRHLVNVVTPEKLTPDVARESAAAAAAAAAAVKSSMAGAGTSAATYDDDFLDMHCDDMDMF